MYQSKIPEFWRTPGSYYVNYPYPKIKKTTPPNKIPRIVPAKISETKCTPRPIRENATNRAHAIITRPSQKGPANKISIVSMVARAA